MKVTALEEYGFRCILQIAQAKPDRHLSCAEIARAERISTPYAAKLLRILRRAGLVKSAAGVKGGYQLSRHPNQITVLQVLKALHGSIFAPSSADFCKCFSGLQEQCVHFKESCCVRSVWTTISSHIEAAFGRITLGELVAHGESAMSAIMGAKFGEDAARRGWVHIATP